MNKRELTITRQLDQALAELCPDLLQGS